MSPQIYERSCIEVTTKRYRSGSDVAILTYKMSTMLIFLKLSCCKHIIPLLYRCYIVRMPFDCPLHTPPCPSQPFPRLALARVQGRPGGRVGTRRHPGRGVRARSASVESRAKHARSGRGGGAGGGRRWILYTWKRLEQRVGTRVSWAG